LEPINSVTDREALVSVPVLSKTNVSNLEISSIESALFKNNPCFPNLLSPFPNANGSDNANAHGQATKSTAVNENNAFDGSTKYQNNKVLKEINRVPTTKYLLNFNTKADRYAFTGFL